MCDLVAAISICC